MWNHFQLRNHTDSQYHMAVSSYHNRYLATYKCQAKSCKEYTVWGHIEAHTGVPGYYNRYHTWKGQAKYIASYRPEHNHCSQSGYSMI